jgi:tetratricopeptide (TPR) repeat protein
MCTADTAASAVLPHRYNIPLRVPAGDPPPLTFAGAEDALAWYDSERVNVVAATRQASSAGLHEIAWRLPAPLFIVFNSRHNWADCIATHRIALDSARRAGNRQGEAWILNNLGDALGRIGDSEGIGHLEQALAIRHEIGDRAGEAQAANNLADAYEHLDRWDEVADLLRRALSLTQAIGDRYGEGVALCNLGAALLELKRTDEAIDALQQAEGVFAEVGYLDGTGYARFILGQCYLSLGRDTEALECLRQSLNSHQAAGNRNRQAVTLRLLASTLARNGQVQQARESYDQAAAIFDDLGDGTQAAEVRAEQAKYGIL